MASLTDTIAEIVRDATRESVHQAFTDLAHKLKPPPTLGPHGKAAYNVIEASKILPLGQKQIYAMCRTGELECFKAGNQFVIPHASIEAWLRRGVEARKAELEAEMQQFLASPSQGA